MDGAEAPRTDGASHRGGEPEAELVAGVELGSGERIAADAVIVATGGISRPETGSTGDGFGWLEELGHRVRRPEPSLVPIAVRESWPARLQGLALEEVKLSALLDGKPQLAASGKLLFTHFGLSGPLVLNLSAGIAEVAQGGPVRLELARTDGELPCHSVSKEMRRALVATMKRMGLTFTSLLGAEKAVVSSGGIAPDELDFRTMASRRYANLCVAGDLIDVDRRSGGYSLQLCWATGWVAGEESARGRISATLR